MNILITSAGQRVSLVRAFQEQVRANHPTGKVYTTDLNPYLSPACQISDRYFRVKRVTDPGYIDQLLDICLRHRISMVVPTIDTELMTLALCKEDFEQLGIDAIVSDPALVAECRDKRKTHAFFAARGIDVPREVNRAAPGFPFFIKPYDGSLSSDTFVIREPGDLRPFHLTNEKLLFLEYIDKQDHDEYTADMYYDKKGILCCVVPRRRIAVRAGEISKGITVKNALVPYLREKLGHIPGAAGCLTGQFFVNRRTGRIIGIEINARFGGGYPLSYRAGANYPAWLIREYFTNQPVTYTDNWEDGLLMLRYDAEVILHESEIHVPLQPVADQLYI